MKTIRLSLVSAALLSIMVFAVTPFGTQGMAAVVEESGATPNAVNADFESSSAAPEASGSRIWHCWYWPYVDYLNPNLYDANEAMHRYDSISGADSRGWEHYAHGPGGNPDAEGWWGHCHAWAGAACWEPQPLASKDVSGVTFRVRDLKGLLVEMYFTCADGTKYELYSSKPSPGLFMLYLKNEIGNYNSMHGESMGFVGELYFDQPGDFQVWNYPVYKYHWSGEGSATSGYSGYVEIWAANDSPNVFADMTSLEDKDAAYFKYYWSGVYFNDGIPTDSGIWEGSGPQDRPDAIWRPYYADTYTKYLENTQLTSQYLAAILEDNSGTFTDVPSDYWAAGYIDKIYQAGITQGCGGGRFCPEDYVTRAQMAKFLLKGRYGSPYEPMNPYKGYFYDVPFGYWAAYYIEQLYDEGITGGCGPGYFCPDDPVNRAQMAKFLLKVLYEASYEPMNPYKGYFYDVPFGYWAAYYIEQLYDEGITGGCGPGYFCPEDYVTRAQMAKFLTLVFNL
ncbi:S-layer homology domain-containing protein [Desulfoferrobacter suflitae]|uniref:S-layer homology domain-containing protein n=1 Tax=Desulfoferrobacter suflitae TaxID=2865782 RepID=UPI002164E17E|nr:S-layer homology domain-containing protein [Desulfoferrobacter suflitae]MCK8602294.1 S-layer homology domain-containing protein [Desulfoferrobacter suflitae]